MTIYLFVGVERAVVWIVKKYYVCCVVWVRVWAEVILGNEVWF